MAKELIFCPNCGRRAEQTGTNKLFCETCDAEFKITTHGAKVEGLGKLKEIEKRVSALEGKPPAEDTDDQEDPTPAEDTDDQEDPTPAENPDDDPDLW